MSTWKAMIFDFDGLLALRLTGAPAPANALINASPYNLGRLLYILVSMKFASRGPYDLDFIKLVLVHNPLLEIDTIQAAQSREDPCVLQEFVNHGWDVNEKIWGQSALEAVTPSETPMKWLLERGADPDNRETLAYRAMTVLEKACYYPYATSLSQLLIQNGAKITKVCLHSTVKNKNTITTEMLLDYGADLDAHGQRYTTPLHQAIEYSCIEQVRLLLARGANKNILNLEGFTAAEAAQRYGTTDIYELLTNDVHVM